MSQQTNQVIAALITLLRQHQRLEASGSVARVALHELTYLVAARTGLAITYEAVRGAVDALCDAGVLRHHPQRQRYTAAAYSIANPIALADQMVTFLAHYRPRWPEFGADLSPEASLLRAYEQRCRELTGRLPSRPNLIELARGVHCLHPPWLAARLRRLEEWGARRKYPQHKGTSHV